MAVNQSWNGNVYSIPQQGDVAPWGSKVTTALQALMQGALSLSGGSFNITSNINFGSSYGLLAPFFSSVSTNTASTGVLRLGSSDTIAWRNPANTADITLSVDSSGNLVFGGGLTFTGNLGATGTVTGGTGLVATTGGLTVNGTTSLTGGRFSVNTTAYTPTSGAPTAFYFRNDNSYTNTDTYTSGSVLIDRSNAIDNNQPTLYIRMVSRSSAIANNSLVVANDAGSGSYSGVTASTLFGTYMEMNSNNSYASDAAGQLHYGGKAKFGVDSNSSAPARAEEKSGQFWIGLRASSNSQFERVFRFRNQDTIGRGTFLSTGSSVEVIPDRDYGAASKLTFQDAYQNFTGLLTSTVSGGTATLDVTGDAGTYIRATSQNGQGSLYAQANNGTSNGYIAIRSNWVTAGTGSAILDMMTTNNSGNSTGYRIQANGVSGALNIRISTAGTITEAVGINTDGAGRTTFYKTGASGNGSIQLGSGGAILSYDGSTTSLSSPASFASSLTATGTVTGGNLSTGGVLSVNGGTGTITSAAASATLVLSATTGHIWTLESRPSDGILHILDNGSTVSTIGGTAGVLSAVTSTTGRLTLGFGTAFLDYGTTNAGRFTFSNNGVTFFPKTQKTQLSTVSSTGATTVVSTGVTDVILNPAAAYAAHTLRLPTTPDDGLTVAVMTNQTITTLTAASADGTAVINGSTATLTANAGAASWLFYAATNTWYRKQ